MLKTRLAAHALWYTEQSIQNGSVSKHETFQKV